MEPLAYSVPEAGEVSRLSEVGIRRAIKRGELPVVRIGNRILIRRTALEQWLIANEHRGEAS